MILEHADNHYYLPLIRLFGRLVEMNHTISRLEAIRTNIIVPNDYPVKVTMSRFGIADITASLFDGCEINAPTQAKVLKEDLTIETEYQYMMRQQCTYYSAQCFEALETFAKDVVFQHIIFNDPLIYYDKKADILVTKRCQLPSGRNLRKLVKRICGPQYNEYSKSNYHQLDFDVFCCVLSETRHAITHSEAILNKKTYDLCPKKRNLINTYFHLTTNDNESSIVTSDNVKLRYLIKHLSEISYQIYKIMSMKDKLDWNLVTNASL